MHLAIHVRMMSHGLHLSGVFKAITLIRSEQKYYAQNRRISMDYVIMLSKTGMAWVDTEKQVYFITTNDSGRLGSDYI